MKRLTFYLFLGLFFLSIDAQRIDPLNFRLKNDLTVLLTEINDFPYLNFALLIKEGGTAYAEREGLPLLTAQLLLKGTATLSGEQLQEKIDLLGATLSANVDTDFTIVSGGVLSKNAPQFFRLLGEILFKPAFSEKEVQKELKRMKQNILEVLNSPQQLVFSYFQHLFFRGQPFSRLSRGTAGDLEKIDSAVVRKYWKRICHPQKMIFAVAGKIGKSELRKSLQVSLGRNLPEKSESLEIPQPVYPAQNRFYLIDKPDAEQAYFVLAFPGCSVGFAEQAEFELFNTIFGGRFTSWLNSELRIKRGLTYGARSAMSSFQQGGVYFLTSYTRNEQLPQMLEIVQQLIGKLKESGLNSEELQSARNYLRGQMPRQFENWSAIVLNNARLYAFKLPFDYYQRLLNKLEQVELSAVNNFARKLLSEQKYLLTVVGKAEVLRKELDRFGNFELCKPNPDFN